MKKERCRMKPVQNSIIVLFILACGLCIPGLMTSAAMTQEAAPAAVEHPMMQPGKYTENMKCPNCGMMLNMWARTRHQFHLGESDLETCSIHCLAERAVREGAEPTDVKAALYLEPEKMVPAADAVYVVGSSAPGTMTMESKLAFADRESAEKFAGTYGGEVTDFAGAYQKASMQVEKARVAIDGKRKKTGKISEPTDQDQCTVCGMKPAAFPNNRAQILTMDKKHVHFCSGKCLVSFLADPGTHNGQDVKPMMIWATVYPEGMYDYAGGLFYVVGSKEHGPMGPEAFAFRTRQQADEFIAKNGGSMVSFGELKPELITQ